MDPIRPPATLVAKDLARTPPAALNAEIEGYAWIPRMLDKARATLAGTEGSYMFGCPVDHTCMARLGVTPELVLSLAARHPDDFDVLAALRERGIPSAADAWFDGRAVEDELQDTGHYLRVRSAATLEDDGHGGRAFPGAQHGAGVSVVVLAIEPGDGQQPHVHPTEEVVVVHRGVAMFTLGRWQARLIGPGEIVRVPAGVIHSLRSVGSEPLGAVAAYAGATVSTERTPADRAGS